MAKVIVAFLSILMLLIWLIGMGGLIYYIFRIVWLQYHVFERAEFKLRQGLALMSQEEQKRLRGYALKAVLSFFGFLAIEFLLSALIRFIRY